MSLITKERPKEELKKHLTIDEIMPTWCEYFDLLVNDRRGVAEYFMDKNDIDITACDRCCVGESWKWSREYSSIVEGVFCNTCRGFSYSIEARKDNYSDIRTFVDLDCGISMGRIGKDWRQTPMVTAFVEHFNRVHVR